MIDVYSMYGAELKALRASRGLTQKAASKELGISERFLRKQESAERVSIVVARAMRDLIMQKTARETARTIDTLLDIYGT